AEEREHRDRAGDSKLLADYREDEIGMRLRQIEHFLAAGAKPDTPLAAGAERDERLDQLKARTLRDLPWMKEGGQPAHPVGFAYRLRREDHYCAPAARAEMRGPG